MSGFNEKGEIINDLGADTPDNISPSRNILSREANPVRFILIGISTIGFLLLANVIIKTISYGGINQDYQNTTYPQSSIASNYLVDEETYQDNPNSNNTQLNNTLSYSHNECSNAPKIRVSVGIQARVTYNNGLALRVRTEPKISNETYIKSIPEGTRFSIIGGPQCFENYWFWKIKLSDGTNGWVAEGDSIDYFIEPFE